MATTTDFTEGAQPLTAAEAASWSLSTAQPVGEALTFSGDAPLPPEGDNGSEADGGTETDTDTDTERHQSAALPGTSVDELIATLPARVVEAMSAKDIDALAAGDSEAVARILLAETSEENMGETPLPDPVAAQEIPQPAETGPERISLRGLTAKDRIALADMVRAVKEGRFASLDEAHAASRPEGAATPAARTEDHEAQVQPSTPAMDHALQRIAYLKSLQQEAAAAYDNATVLQLNGAMAEATLALHQAGLEQQSQQYQAQSWTHHEAQHIASVQQQLAADLADQAFSKALVDERELADHRDDPIMHMPDWPARLAARVRERLQRQPAGGARSQARARGMVASPSARGGPALSLDEAYEQIEGLSESQVDAVLSQMREREKASRFSRIA